MLVQEIEMTRPLKLEADDKSEVYLTHSVWTDVQDEPFALLTTYDGEDIHVFPAQYNKEKELFEALPEDIASAIGAYVEAHPIEVLEFEQIKEVAYHEQ